MPKLYSTGVLVVMTAYIRADSEEEARAKIAELKDTGLEFPDRRQMVGEGLEMTGAPYSSLFDDEEYDDITLSPACTLVGAGFETAQRGEIVLDLAEGDEEDDVS